jgi:hypothetical protein
VESTVVVNGVRSDNGVTYLDGTNAISVGASLREAKNAADAARAANQVTHARRRARAQVLGESDNRLRAPFSGSQAKALFAAQNANGAPILPRPRGQAVSQLIRNRASQLQASAQQKQANAQANVINARLNKINTTDTVTNTNTVTDDSDSDSDDDAW